MHVHTQPSERASSTHSIFPKTYINTEESLEEKIQQIKSTVLVLREQLTQLKRELSIRESEHKTSRDKLKKIKEEKEKGCGNELHATQLNYYKRLESEYSDAYRKVKAKRREKEEMEGKISWVERDRQAYEERLQTLRSNRSKYEEPVRLIERTQIPSNRQSAASSVASMGPANSQRSLTQERSSDSLIVHNAARSEHVHVQVSDSNTSTLTAVSDADTTFILPSLNTDPLSHLRPPPNVSPTHRRNITLPSLQSSVAANKPPPSAGSTRTAIRPRPPRSARPSTGQARSAAPRCHRRRSSLMEPLNLSANDCPNCAQLRLDLQRSRQTILRLRLNSNAN